MKWWYENEEEKMELYKNEDLCIGCKNAFFSKPYDHRDPTPGQLGYCIKCDNFLIKDKKMEFDKSRVYTAVNADELRAGDKVIGGNTLADLKYKVGIETLDTILDEGETYRFTTKEGEKWLMVLLVERKENCTNCGKTDCSAHSEHDDFKVAVCSNWIPKAESKTEQKAEHDCQSCKYKNCGFKDFNTKNECDRWEAEQKAEKKYRPFETIGELINEWVIKGGKWQHREKTMPLIWVRGKNCSVNRLITSFDETEKGDRVMICGLDCSMEDLFNIYTFLDGSPCGVEE